MTMLRLAEALAGSALLAALTLRAVVLPTHLPPEIEMARVPEGAAVEAGTPIGGSLVWGAEGEPIALDLPPGLHAVEAWARAADPANPERAMASLVFGAVQDGEGSFDDDAAALQEAIDRYNAAVFETEQARTEFQAMLPLIQGAARDWEERQRRRDELLAAALAVLEAEGIDPPPGIGSGPE